MKDLRNAYHILIGFSIGYLIMLSFGFNASNFPLSLEYLNNFLFPLVAGVICLGIGFLWERYQETKLGFYSDMKDVYRTAIGGISGAILEYIFGNWILAAILALVSIIVVVKHYKK